MSRALELLAQYETKIAKDGQWVAIRRYTGVGASRPWVDTLARAYVRHYDSKELIGSIVQGDVSAISLVDTLSGILPITTNDKLVLGFTGFDVLGTTPTLTGSHVSGGKETAIKNPMKRTPGGTLIALEIHASG
jgi:hypothetical protein